MRHLHEAHLSHRLQKVGLWLGFLGALLLAAAAILSMLGPILGLGLLLFNIACLLALLAIAGFLVAAIAAVILPLGDK